MKNSSNFNQETNHHPDVEQNNRLEESGDKYPGTTNLKFRYREGIYAHFFDKFHDIDMEIVLNLDNSKALYDRETLMKAFEKDGVINWLNTNEHIFWVFLSGFSMGENYDPSKEYQEYKFEDEEIEFLNTNLPRATNLEFQYRQGEYWYFWDSFHDIETNEISINSASRQILYGNDFLKQAFEKKDVADWMQTSERILFLFMTGVRVGQGYDCSKEFQYD